jgi:hypothetical protein
MITDVLIATVQDPDAVVDTKTKASISKAEAETRAVAAFEFIFANGPKIEFDHHLIYYARKFITGFKLLSLPQLTLLETTNLVAFRPAWAILRKDVSILSSFSLISIWKSDLLVRRADTAWKVPFTCGHMRKSLYRLQCMSYSIRPCSAVDALNKKLPRL